MAKSRRPDIKSLYYITHVDNVPSIVSHGILSHSEVERRAVPYTAIYDSAIVNRRKERVVEGSQSLWDFANLYVQPRNPMMYRVVHERGDTDLAVVAVSPGVVGLAGSYVSLGNAASLESDIVPTEEGMEALADQWAIINSEWWNPNDGSKRKIMAECLVPTVIPPDHIHTVYVSNHDTAARLREQFPTGRPAVVPEPHMFFRPLRRIQLTGTLSLVEGDMFFSGMQTLTVSVNVVGIMGKGLASRAKYQFPDVYVVYQDACRRRRLQMGQPYLYKRESFVDEELADEPQTLPNPNARKWFLLFATKKHWRERGDMAGIEAGLAWIRERYQNEGIRSLAMPALGCGLGHLQWREVGPLMCRYLADLGIQVAVYLPRERKTPSELLTSDFLLGGNSEG